MILNLWHSGKEQHGLAQICVAGLLALALTSCGQATSERGEEAKTSQDSLTANFQNPPNEFRIIQYSHDLEKGVEKFPAYGIGGIMTFFFEELYQSGPEGPKKIGSSANEAAAKGFKLWLGDDFGYPSGMAGGRIVAENPDFEVRGLAMTSLDGFGPSRSVIELPKWGERFVSATLYPLINGHPDLAAGKLVPVVEDRIETDGIDGPWRLCAFVKVIRTGQAASTSTQFGHTGKYPDLLNPSVTARFLANMHEPIFAQINDPTAKIEGFYTNEPNLMQLHWKLEDAPYACVSWSPGLPEKFREMHGYELLPTLAALYGGDSREARRTRMHFQQTVAEMLATNYARQITEWCNVRGLHSSGHFILNQYLAMNVACYGDLMKFESEFDVPGTQIGIPDPDAIHSYPYQQTRLAGSVAAWKGRKEVILLLDPIIFGGGLKRLSPSVPLMMNAANMGFLNGANQMSTYVPFDPQDNGKTKATGYSPGEYRQFSEYIGRIASVLRGADRETSTALYYPIATFQADYLPSGQHWTKILPTYEKKQREWDRLERTLLSARIEYGVVHPEGVTEAGVVNGVMKIGTGSYRYLVMPRIEFLPRAVLEKIKAFESGGGTVLWVDGKPEAGEDASEDELVKKSLENAKVIPASVLASRLKEPLQAPFDLEFGLGSDELAIAKFRRAGRAVYYLVNRTGTDISVQVQTASGGNIRILDPSSGSITEKTLPADLNLQGFRSLIIVREKAD